MTGIKYKQAYELMRQKTQDSIERLEAAMNRIENNPDISTDIKDQLMDAQRTAHDELQIIMSGFNTFDSFVSCDTKQ